MPKALSVESLCKNHRLVRLYLFQCINQICYIRRQKVGKLSIKRTVFHYKTIWPIIS